MPKLAGIKHLEAIRAFGKAGFQISRQGKHVTMSDGRHHLTIPRNNPIDPYTMAAIIKSAGLTIDQFKRLL
jgi:predicted RNA binding protein YcfA (HicA-like mRNA interferase family)